jgi:hypothetical protein
MLQIANSPARYYEALMQPPQLAGANAGCRDQSDYTLFENRGRKQHESNHRLEAQRLKLQTG